MSAIKGRADDMLIIRGVNVYPTQVESVLSTFKELTANYQLVLTREAALDKLEVKVEALKAHDLLDEEIALKIKGTIGISAEVSIAPRGTIPRSQGGKLNRVSDQR
jgi:phenylacetate-CoA ligase